MNAITRWLLIEGRRASDLQPLMLATIEQYRRDEIGVPIDRLWAGTLLLHPQAAAYFWVWERDRPDEMLERELSYARFAELDDRDSPARRLRNGASSVRARLRDRDEPHELEELETLRQRGYTDFFALPLLFRGAFAGAFTWATRAPDGFSGEHLELLEATLPALSAVVEPLAREQATATLLRTYLGPNAGEQVLSGQVRRGDGQTIRAAIWFCDIRGFTRLTGAIDQTTLLGLLSDTFEVIVKQLAAHGGEVLKFMGDGVLAIFPERRPGEVAEEGARPTARVCAAAYRATEAVLRELAAVHETRRAAGLPVAPIGVGLHHGDVMYGNIGAPARLDFTVIGMAVNVAARIEGLCGELARDVLASRRFADSCGGPTTRVGEFALKGVAERVEIYALELATPDRARAQEPPP